MKVISIWQPWASLIVHNHKFNETRSWPAPRSLIGQRIGIAATKQLKPEQFAAYEDPDFKEHYACLGMPELEELPRGCILGTAVLHSVEEITAELMEDTTDQELAFGWYAPGRFIWRMRAPEAFATPIPARGAQGVWEFPGEVAQVIRLDRGEGRDYARQERA